MARTEQGLLWLLCTGSRQSLHLTTWANFEAYVLILLARAGHQCFVAALRPSGQPRSCGSARAGQGLTCSMMPTYSSSGSRHR